MPVNLGRAVAAGIVLLLSACSSTNNSIASTSISEPTATVEPTTKETPTPTLEPTPSPTQEAKGVVVKVRALVKAWKRQYSDYVNFQVIVELKNTGTGWAQIAPGQSDYTILSKAGDVVTTGSFTYAFPEFVAPGAVAFLVDDGSDIGSSNTTIADYAQVEVDGKYNAVDVPDAVFTFSGIRLKAESFGGGLVATGFVTSTTDVSDAAIAVVCLDASGVPLGATWTNLVRTITAGKRKGFETVGGTPPLRASQCSKLFGGAENAGF